MHACVFLHILCRDAGGAFGKMEAAQEEQYFRKLSAQQMESLKQHHHDEIANLEQQIKQESVSFYTLYIHSLMRAYTHVGAHACRRARAHTCRRARAHTCRRSRAHTCRRARAHACRRTHAHVCRRARAHVCRRTHAHACRLLTGMSFTYYCIDIYL